MCRGEYSRLSRLWHDFGPEKNVADQMVKCILKLTPVLAFAASVSFSQVCDPERSTLTVRDASLNESQEKVVKIIHGKVVFVIDGDSITVLADDGKPYPVRLFGIDAPDLKQPFGQQSVERLGKELMGKDVTLISHYVDKKGRYFADVFLRGEDVALGQIGHGMAWFSNSERCNESFDRRTLYLSTESSAKTERLGLWRDPNPLPPWNYRETEYEKNTARSALRPILSSAKQDQNSIDVEQLSNATINDPQKDRKYFLGPRGGCYYINEKKVRVYLGDKSLCEK